MSLDTRSLAVRRTRPTDCHRVGRRLRPWDRIECSMNGLDGTDHMLELLWRAQETHDPVWSIVDRLDRAVGVGGVRTYHPRMGLVWLLGTPELEEDPRAFFALSRFQFDRVTRGFDRLDNVLPRDRHGARRWLTWLGFEFEPAIVHHSGLEVLPFRWVRPGVSAVVGPACVGGPAL